MSEKRLAKRDRATRSTSRGEKTKREILVAAKAVFAEKGFDAARMEDIATAVGVKRASLVYYYKDKVMLYEAMIENVMTQLFVTIQDNVHPHLPLEEQIENCAVAWIEFVWQNPDFLKILLREGINPSDWLQREVSNLFAPVHNLFQELSKQRQKCGESGDSTVNPNYVCSTLAGSTLFSLSVGPNFYNNFDKLASNEEQLEKKKFQIRRLTRFLLSE